MFDYRCKWGLLRCWGDKSLGKYENERHITFKLGKLGYHWRLQTFKRDRDLRFGIAFGWNQCGLYVKCAFYKWEFTKMIFWE
jgi:hypothetical protein